MTSALITLGRKLAPRRDHTRDLNNWLRRDVGLPERQPEAPFSRF